MESPNWEAFSDFFAAQDDEPASERREAFLKQHGEWQQVESALEDYQSTFINIYGVHLDWKEGIFSLLEALSDILGEEIFPIEFDYDSEIESATINIAGKQHVFHHYQIETEGFEAELARIENILAQSGYALRVYCEGEPSDMMSLLLMPSTAWKRVEQCYRPEHISAYFIPYRYQFVAEDAVAPTVKGTSFNKQKASDDSEFAYLFVWLQRIFLWCVLPVLAVFIISGLWNRLTRTEPLPPPQPKGCEKIEKMHSNLQPEVDEELKARMRESLGCK
ncbi:hypothetical protein HC231_06800 [Brenneria izadpanahii]|uniref:Uncharacterized protein n=1 Tax=Brenneria izadpanahii TaxID=2722756 RepID=A0ABX7UVD4_9GAMM|nr:hypothetical protein [Brenneria izadpanahii]QTF07668.1 hypothetical protein HC231_06800 [Brenneria izadpanahii]